MTQLSLGSFSYEGDKTVMHTGGKTKLWLCSKNDCVQGLRTFFYGALKLPSSFNFRVECTIEYILGWRQTKCELFFLEYV